MLVRQPDSSPGFREYLGLGENWRTEEPQDNPVPKDHYDRLREVLIWIYGSKADSKIPVIRSQNPDIKKLSEVLARPEARRMLASTGALNQAHALVDTREVRFENALIRSTQYAEEAQSLIDAYVYDASIEKFGERLRDIANTVVQVMFSKAPKKKK